MKKKLRHILTAAVPFWAVQLVVFLAGYTDGRVIRQVYLPIFAACVFGILLDKLWMSHGLWLSASAGLMTEWLVALTDAGGRANRSGVLYGMAVLLLGTSVSILLQAAVDFRKKKAAERAAKQV